MTLWSLGLTLAGGWTWIGGIALVLMALAVLVLWEAGKALRRLSSAT
jgi:hypothetical protein